MINALFSRTSITSNEKLYNNNSNDDEIKEAKRVLKEI